MYNAPTLHLRPATADDKGTIGNLIQLYLYDMSSAHPFAIGRDGRYEYDFLNQFWQYPYLFFSDDELTGFALVIDHCPITSTQPIWFMAEFFVLRSFRRKSLGTTMLNGLFAHHAGRWHIANQIQNLDADLFWSNATGSKYDHVIETEFDHAHWRVRQFTIVAGT